jgi:glycosyltransferase involved in cell wall biosynthesis
MAAMHILISALSSARGPSGICRHAYNIARCASTCSEILNVTFVIGKWQEEYFTAGFGMPNAKIKLFCVEIANNPISRNLWYLRVLPHIAKALSIDIVHLSFPVPILRESFDCPLVVSLHDFYPYDQPDNFGFPKVIFNRVFLQLCLREIDIVACVSEATSSSLKKRLKRSAHRKVVTIPNCVDQKKIDIAKQFTPLIDKPFLLSVAQHRANKNILLTLRVFSDLIRGEAMSKETLLVLVGNSGPETIVIRSFIKGEGLEKNVKMMTGISSNDLIWLYKKCEITIASSFTEGFGFPVAEALLYGSRVVCSDIPAFREIGEDACCYFDLKSASPAAAMTAAVHRSLAGLAPRLKLHERFSLENVSERYAALYMELAKNI